MKDMYRILWRDQFVATVTDVGWLDFPWAWGKFRVAEMTPQMRGLLEWIDRESKTEDGIITDAPYPEELQLDWFLESPDGTRNEIMIPIFDFADGSVEWR